MTDDEKLTISVCDESRILRPHV